MAIWQCNLPFTPQTVTASGGTVSGSVTVSSTFADNGFYWTIERTGGQQSAATLYVDGQDVGGSYTGNTEGEIPILIEMPSWDGSGPKSSKGNRLDLFKLKTFNSGGTGVSFDSTPRDTGIRQLPPDDVPFLFLGGDDVEALYLGEDEVQKMFLGDIEVYSANSGQTSE